MGRPMVSPGVTLRRLSFPRISQESPQVSQSITLLNVYNFVEYQQLCSLYKGLPRVSPCLLRVSSDLHRDIPGLPRSPQSIHFHCFSGLNVIRLTGDLSWMKEVILAWILYGPWSPQVCLGSPQISPGSSQDYPRPPHSLPRYPQSHPSPIASVV